MLTADNITTLQDKHYTLQGLHYLLYKLHYNVTRVETECWVRLGEVAMTIIPQWSQVPGSILLWSAPPPPQHCGPYCSMDLVNTCSLLISRYPLVIQVNTFVVRWPFCCFQEFLFKNKCLNPQKSINTRLHWLCVQTVKIFVKKCSAALMFPPPPLWPIPEVTNFSNGAPQLELETNLREVWSFTITEKVISNVSRVFKSLMIFTSTSNFAKVHFQL